LLLIAWASDFFDAPNLVKGLALSELIGSADFWRSNFILIRPQLPACARKADLRRRYECSSNARKAGRRNQSVELAVWPDAHDEAVSEVYL